MTMSQQPISTDSLLQESRTFPPGEAVKQRALIRAGEYEALYRRSVSNPDAFWLEQAQTLEWIKRPTIAGRHTWDTAARKIEHAFFEDGVMNITANCLDRHVREGKADKVAILWQGDGEEEVRRITYGQLLPCHPSPFLKEMPEELVEHSDEKSKKPVTQESGKKLFATLRESLPADQPGP